MCSFPVWCLWQGVEYDNIGSWSLPFHLLRINQPSSKACKHKHLSLVVFFDQGQIFTHRGKYTTMGKLVACKRSLRILIISVEKIPLLSQYISQICKLGYLCNTLSGTCFLKYIWSSLLQCLVSILLLGVGLYFVAAVCNPDTTQRHLFLTNFNKLEINWYTKTNPTLLLLDNS